MYFSGAREHIVKYEWGGLFNNLFSSHRTIWFLTDATQARRQINMEVSYNGAHSHMNITTSATARISLGRVDGARSCSVRFLLSQRSSSVLVRTQPAVEDYVPLRAWVHSDGVALAPYTCRSVP
jgi:hypothetical protein